MATIITKNSSTASSVPLNTQLVQGELAVNVTDKRLFTENASGTVVELGTNPSSLALPNGSANGVAYLNGSKVLTTGSALTYNGVGLGIGVASATQLLNLSGSGTSNIQLVSTDSGGKNLLISVSGSLASLRELNGNPLAFDIGGSEQMRLTSTGLGIGTSSPVQKLHVNGNIAVQGSSFPAIKWYNGAGTNVAELYFGAGGGNDLNIVNYQAGPLVFKTNNTTQATLDSSGNLGLGVTPSAWATYKSIDLPAGGYVSSGGDWMEVMMNTYYNGGYKYKYNGYASHYLQQSGVHSWYTAPSGTAGNAISFTQAMTLDAIGRLGIGTTSPLARLHVSDAGASGVEVSPVGGYISGAYIQAYNRSTSAYIPLELNGSTIAFFNNNAERARIDSSGNLLVGTTSLVTDASCFNFSPGNAWGIFGHATGVGSGTEYVKFRLGSSQIGSITQNGTTAVAYNTSSDYRLKEDIQPMTGALAKVALLKPCTYKWKADGSDGEGFIAHELAEVAPQCVTGEKDAVDAEGKPVYQGIDTSFLVATLTAAIQEQQAIIESLTDRIAALEAK